MRRSDRALILGVFVVALVYLLLLRRYGFQLEDEGILLFAFDRVMRGQQPYLDFHSGYTPGFFAFGTTVSSLFGPSATALRAVLAVLNALTAAGLAATTRRVAGRWLAPLPEGLRPPARRGTNTRTSTPTSGRDAGRPPSRIAQGAD